MKRLRTFAKGALIGFTVMRVMLGIVHGQPAPSWPPINKVAVPVKVHPVKGKCIQMGFTPCGPVKPATTVTNPFRQIMNTLRPKS